MVRVAGYLGTSSFEKDASMNVFRYFGGSYTSSDLLPFVDTNTSRYSNIDDSTIYGFTTFPPFLSQNNAFVYLDDDYSMADLQSTFYRIASPSKRQSVAIGTMYKMKEDDWLEAINESYNTFKVANADRIDPSNFPCLMPGSCPTEEVWRDVGRDPKLSKSPYEEPPARVKTGAIAGCCILFFFLVLFITYFIYRNTIKQQQRNLNLMRYEASKRKNVLEMKRLFVRFVSHEIRTPLNTVCMGLELLESELTILSKQNNNAHPKSSSSSLHNGNSENEEEDETEKHQGQYMRVCGDEDIAFCRKVTMDVRENAHTAVEILNDLLNYDKLETGTLKLETEIVFIWDLVERTVNQFRIQAVNKEINFELHLDKPQEQENDGINHFKDEETGASTSLSSPGDLSDRWNVIGDDVRLSQVIRNVISNALKFTHTNGTIQVTVLHLVDGLPNAKPLVLEGEHVGHYPRSGSIQIRVQDSGVGLSKEQLQQLFSEGVQFDANQLQHGGGSGLGLSIAKGIVEQHNGIIRAESKGQGHGTCFIIELPLFEFTSEELEKRSDEINKLSMSQTVITSDSSETSEEFVPRSRRILVAEDAESSRKMLIRLLERAGHTCVPAADGQEAVDAVKADMQRMKENPNNKPFDTIFMDFEMPILNGPDATKVIRQLGFTNTIVGVTGNLLAEDVEYFKSHGADDILGKPVSLAKLNAYWDEQSIKRKVRMEIFHGRESGTA
jgi:signal transduction histidine kinase